MFLKLLEILFEISPIFFGIILLILSFSKIMTKYFSKTPRCENFFQVAPKCPQNFSHYTVQELTKIFHKISRKNFSTIFESTSPKSFRKFSATYRKVGRNYFRKWLPNFSLVTFEFSTKIIRDYFNQLVITNICFGFGR